MNGSGSETGIIIRQALQSDIDSLVSLLKILFRIEEDFAVNETLQQQGLDTMSASPCT